MTLFNWLNEFICGIGILMSLAWLLNRKWWFAGGQHLAIYLLIFSLIFLEQNLYWRQFFLSYPHLVLITDPLALLLGPMLYLHSLGRERIGLRNNWIHFIPFVVILLAYLPVYLLSTTEKVEFVINTIWNGRDINAWRFILFRALLIIQIVCYGFLIQRKSKYHWNKLFTLSSRIPLSQLLLLSYFLYGILRVIWVLFTVAFDYEYIAMVDGVIRIVTAIIIFYLFVHAVNEIKVGRSGQSYSNSPIDHREVLRLKESLVALMQDRQPFLKKDLKMIEVAVDLKISEHKLSQLLNVHLGINFFEYINEYRIKRARQLLKDPGYQRFTIEAIAKECGFNSKSTFNEAFRRMEGVTPSIFKKT